MLDDQAGSYVDSISFGWGCCCPAWHCDHGFRHRPHVPLSSTSRSVLVCPSGSLHSSHLQSVCRSSGSSYAVMQRRIAWPTRGSAQMRDVVMTAGGYRRSRAIVGDGGPRYPSNRASGYGKRPIAWRTFVSMYMFVGCLRRRVSAKVVRPDRRADLIIARQRIRARDHQGEAHAGRGGHELQGWGG